MEETNIKKNQYKISNNCNANNHNDSFNLLQEIFGKVDFNVKLVAGAHNKCCFQVAMVVNEKVFCSAGTTLKQAKESCALEALANLCYSFGDDKEMHPHVPIPQTSYEKNDDDNVHISHSKNKKMVPRRTLEEKGFPILAEDNKSDSKTKREKHPNRKLQNITNLPPSVNSKIKFAAKVSNLKTSTVHFKSENFISKTWSKSKSISDVGSVLESKSKSLQITKNVTTTKQFSSMDMASVEVKVSLKRFYKNPTPLDNPTLLLNEQLDYLDVNNQKDVLIHKFKEMRDGNSELSEFPKLKTRANPKTKALYKISRTKWYQKNSNNLSSFKKSHPKLIKFVKARDREFFSHGKRNQLAQNGSAIQISNYVQNNNDEPSRAPPSKQNCQEIIKYSIPKNSEISSLLLSSHIADIIEAKIMQRFDQLTCGIQEIRKYKVLAGIVMTFDMNFEKAEVVSIATGTKCVNSSNICCNGSVLNDSHAEIVAKRCLMKFLYGQLRCHCTMDSNRNSIFQRNPNGFQTPYRLKPNVHFHLYINTAPCGDARIFNFNHKNNVQYGQLQTKVDGKIGTIPVSMSYYPQSWDGVILGEPLHTMSCSDKIARWNVVGIQGALLSQFINPIYLYSIILGRMFNSQHVSRAVFGRLQFTLGYLPQLYRLNRPMLGQTSKPQYYYTYGASRLGINWTLGDRDIEIISLPTGRKIYNETSLLSKKALFFNFWYLCRNLPNIGNAYLGDNYAEAKENAIDYQKAKMEVFAAFYRANLGNWVKKPIEQNEFQINSN